MEEINGRPHRTKDKKIMDHQSPCPIRKQSNFLTIFIAVVLAFVACLTLFQVVLQVLTLPQVHPPSSHNSFLHTRATVPFGDGEVPSAHDHERPWTDPNWVRKVQQSAVPKKAGGYCVLVTGSAGFIGSYASVSMRQKGWGVVGIDNFNDYYDPALKRERQAHVYKKGRNFIVDGDINDEMLLRELFKIVQFTHVLHLAAQTGHGFRLQSEHFYRPLSYVKSNVAGLVTLLEVCSKANPQPAIVWASSSSVYGLSTRVPFSEFEQADQPTSLYAATKKAGEEIVHVYNHLYGLSITGLRLFDVYGPWSRPDMEVFKITKAILNEEPIVLFAEEAHDLSYIDEIIMGIIAAVETADRSIGLKKAGEKNVPRAQLRLFNLGAGLPTRMTDIINIVENLLKKKAKEVIQLQEMEGLSHIYAVANLSLAEKHLGYAPQTDLKDGLKKFVAWYHHRYAKAHVV